MRGVGEEGRSVAEDSGPSIGSSGTRIVRGVRVD